jgi:hypothetical protein
LLSTTRHDEDLKKRDNRWGSSIDDVPTYK